MKQLLNPQTISIAIELAKDIWQLLHDAKHPHHESRVVEGIKNQLANSIKQVQLPPPQETVKDISQ
jgi:hypothetical protein